MEKKSSMRRGPPPTPPGTPVDKARSTMARPAKAAAGAAKGSNEKRTVGVFVRTRPLCEKDEKRGPFKIDAKEVTYKGEKGGTRRGEHKYEFERVFPEGCQQQEVFDHACKPLIDNVLQGYSCTLFAYGQTNSGKTHTMMGASLDDGGQAMQDDTKCGVIPRAAKYLFDRLLQQGGCNTVRISCAELYNEGFYDMLSQEDQLTQLRLFADEKGRLTVKGLTEHTVHDLEEIMKKLQHASKRRHTAQTGMNDRSSRSHFITTIYLTSRTEADVRTQDGEGKQESFRQGKIHLVDLAGSESARRADTTGKRAQEGASINRSLLTLGKVITKLSAASEKRADSTEHIPYRESALTRFLQDALGGKAITHIIATMSLSLANSEESLSTLEYAATAKKIENEPEVNNQISGASLASDYMDQVARLREELKAQRSADGFVKLDPEELERMNKETNALREANNEKEVKIKELNDTVTEREQKIGDLEQDRKRKHGLLNRHQRTEATLAWDIDQRAKEELKFEEAVRHRTECLHQNARLLGCFLKQHAEGVSSAVAQVGSITENVTHHLRSAADGTATIACEASATADQCATSVQNAARAHHSAQNAGKESITTASEALQQQLKASATARRSATEAENLLRSTHAKEEQDGVTAIVTATQQQVEGLIVAGEARRSAAVEQLATGAAEVCNAVSAAAKTGTGELTEVMENWHTRQTATRNAFHRDFTAAVTDHHETAAAAAKDMQTKISSADEDLCSAGEGCSQQLEWDANTEVTGLKRRRDALEEAHHAAAKQAPELRLRAAALHNQARWQLERVDEWQNTAIAQILASATAMRSEVRAAVDAAVAPITKEAEALEARYSTLASKITEFSPPLDRILTAARMGADAMRVACAARRDTGAAHVSSIMQMASRDATEHSARMDDLAERVKAEATECEKAAADVSECAMEAEKRIARVAAEGRDDVCNAQHEQHSKHATAERADASMIISATTAAAEAEEAQRADREAAAVAAATERDRAADATCDAMIHSAAQMPDHLTNAMAPHNAHFDNNAKSAGEQIDRLKADAMEGEKTVRTATETATASLTASLSKVREAATELGNASDQLGKEFKQEEPTGTPKARNAMVELTQYDSPITVPSALGTPVPRSFAELSPPRNHGMAAAAAEAPPTPTVPKSPITITSPKAGMMSPFASPQAKRRRA